MIQEEASVSVPAVVVDNHTVDSTGTVACMMDLGPGREIVRREDRTCSLREVLECYTDLRPWPEARKG